jgi:hypothetical protein
VRIRVTHSIDDLARDLTHIAGETKPVIAHQVQRNANLGNGLAKGYARQSAGKHGKHYPNAFSVERTGVLSYEYGPDSSMPQGGMSFEYGSRNQPPHLDLAKSADIIADKFGPDVLDAVADLFWPGS